MFITKRKHDALMEEMAQEIIAHQDAFARISSHANWQATRLNELTRELAAYRATRARQIANLTAANARRSEAARGKGE